MPSRLGLLSCSIVLILGCSNESSTVPYAPLSQGDAGPKHPKREAGTEHASNSEMDGGVETSSMQDASSSSTQDASSSSPADASTHGIPVIPAKAFFDPDLFYRAGAIGQHDLDDMMNGVPPQNNSECRHLGLVPFLSEGGPVDGEVQGVIPECWQEYNDDHVLPREIVISSYNGELVYMKYARDFQLNGNKPPALAVLGLDMIKPNDAGVCCSYSPADSYENDKDLTTLCEPDRFWLSPDDEGLVYRCALRSEGYKELSGDDYDLPAGYEIVALGNDKHALLYGTDAPADAGGAAAHWAVRDKSGKITVIDKSEDFLDPYGSMPHLQNRPVNFYMIGPRAVSDGWLLVRADELWAIGLDASLKMKGRYEMAFDVAGDPGTPTFRVQSGKIHNPMHNCSGDSCDYHVTSEFANCNLTKRGVLTCWGGWHGYQGGLRADYNVILTAVTGESFRIVSPDWLLDPSQVDEELMAKPQPGGSYYVGVKQSLFVTGP